MRLPQFFLGALFFSPARSISESTQTAPIDCLPASTNELAYRRATLFEEREGFGRNTTGGGDEADWRVVNTTADDGPGSLRSLVGDHDPKWITFDVSGTRFPG